MGLIISILYAPLVLVALQYFDIKLVSVVMFFISIIWFGLVIKKDKKEWFYPILYVFVAIGAFLVNDFLVLKILPSIVALFIALVFFVSYLQKKSIILHFVKKYKKEEISKNEEEYIHKSTLFWIGVCLLNTLIHIYAFYDNEVEFWLFYSTIGGYLMFIVFGFLQMLHRKYIFKG